MKFSLTFTKMFPVFPIKSCSCYPLQGSLLVQPWTAPSAPAMFPFQISHGKQRSSDVPRWPENPQWAWMCCLWPRYPTAVMWKWNMSDCRRGIPLQCHEISEWEHLIPHWKGPHVLFVVCFFVIGTNHATSSFPPKWNSGWWDAFLVVGVQSLFKEALLHLEVDKSQIGLNYSVVLC